MHRTQLEIIRGTAWPESCTCSNKRPPKSWISLGRMYRDLRRWLFASLLRFSRARSLAAMGPAFSWIEHVKKIRKMFSYREILSNARISPTFCSSVTPARTTSPSARRTHFLAQSGSAFLKTISKVWNDQHGIYSDDLLVYVWCVSRRCPKGKLSTWGCQAIAR